MDLNKKPKIGAPPKDVTKTKISITVAAPLLEANKAKAGSDNESFSARVARALELLDAKEAGRARRGGPRGDRGFNPNL